MTLPIMKINGASKYSLANGNLTTCTVCALHVKVARFLTPECSSSAP